MCGISGLVGSSDRVYARDCVRKMNAALARRGPDSEGIDSWNLATLGHRRLSIFDHGRPASLRSKMERRRGPSVAKFQESMPSESGPRRARAAFILRAQSRASTRSELPTSPEIPHI